MPKQPLFRVLLACLLAAGVSCGSPERRAGRGVARAGDPLVVPDPLSGFAVDVDHYSLDLVLDPARRRIEGECTVRLYAAGDSLARMRLDFAGLDVREVVDADGRSLEHEHQGDDLWISLARPLTRDDYAEVTVRYSGSPRKGLWFVGGGADAPTHVFTQGGLEDARYWFPCHDVPADRATSEIRVTLPEDWISVAAGERIDSRTDGNRRTDHWRMTQPHPSYLMTLVAGDLTQVQSSGAGVPLTYLAPERYAQRLESSLAMTPAALEFMESITGKRYPYPKYSQACVEEFPFGGMENVSATTLTVSALRDEIALRDTDATGLVVHEAAHQWFGDLMTCRDWSHVWLNEGFATYMTRLFQEREEGIDAFRIAMRDDQERYTRADRGAQKRPLVHAEYVDATDLLSRGHAYAGGATRLHLLRFILGDEAFFRGLRYYVGRNAGRGVVTDDLRLAFEEVSGEDLGTFFDQWLYAPGHPEFDVRWAFDADRERVLLTVNQTQEVADGTPEAFLVPVEVEVRVGDESVVHRIQIERRRHLFELEASAEPAWVYLDPRGFLPARVSSRKDVREWVALAGQSESVLARRDAVRALGDLLDHSDDAALRTSATATLLSRLAADASPAVRAAAATAFSEARARTIPEVRAALLRRARSDEFASVRVAALDALGPVTAGVPDPELTRFATEAYGSRFSYETMAAAARLAVRVDARGAFDWLRERLGEDSPHGELRAGLVRALAQAPDASVPGVLRKAALDDEAAVAVRIAAIEGLVRRTVQDPGGIDAARGAFETLLASRVARVRRAAVEALAGFGDPQSLGVLETYYPTCVFPREKRVIEAALAKAAA